MKKILFIFIVSIITSLYASAKLPNTILDCTFDKSTSSNVKQSLNRFGFEPIVNPNGSLFYSFINTSHPNIDDTTPKLFGTWWQGCLFMFSNGVLSDILLQNEYVNINFAEDYYNIVNDFFQKNYSKYYWKPIIPSTKQGYKEIKGVYYNSDNLYFKLFYGESDGKPFVTLQAYYR